MKKSTKLKPIREGFHSLTPYLYVRGTAIAIEFYRRAFGASVRPSDRGAVQQAGYAELLIGDCVLILSSSAQKPDAPFPRSPADQVPSFLLYVTDVDVIFRNAVSAGARVISLLIETAWGDRHGVLLDPFGYVWSLATHVRDRTQTTAPDDEPERVAELAGR